MHTLEAPRSRVTTTVQHPSRHGVRHVTVRVEGTGGGLSSSYAGKPAGAGGNGTSRLGEVRDDARDGTDWHRAPSEDELRRRNGYTPTVERVGSGGGWQLATTHLTVPGHCPLSVPAQLSPAGLGRLRCVVD